MLRPAPGSVLSQPRAVWAVAFAVTVAFMGIGLVDPILPAISRALDAPPAQAMLLFTSYLFITSLAMFFSAFISSRIGTKATLLAGLAFIVVFAALAGSAGSVDAVISFRGGWGLGNALFLSTALATIVGAASGGAGQAIILYEAALGLGMATGPLLGGLLGSVSWRGPFFGTAVLMGIAFIAIILLLPKGGAKPQPVPFTAAFAALKHPGLLIMSVAALMYNFAFFSVLAYSPFPLEAAAHAAGIKDFGAHELGLIFCGWGVCLALTSIFVTPVLNRILGHLPTLIGALLMTAGLIGGMVLAVDSLPTLTALVVFSGLSTGVVNTVLTEAIMEVSRLPRPVASSTYSGVRFLGGAVSPIVSGALAAGGALALPYAAGAAGAVIAALLILSCYRAVQSAEVREARRARREGASELDTAYALTAGDS